MLKTNLKLEKFKKALNALQISCEAQHDEQGLYVDATIQRFEFTFELAWKFLKDYFSEKGLNLNYPKEVIKEAFSVGLIDDEALWVQMLSDRNMTSHTYDEHLAREIYHHIRGYVPAFMKLLKNVS